MFSKNKKKINRPDKNGDKKNSAVKQSNDESEESAAKRCINWKFVIILALAVELALVVGIGLTLWITSQYSGMTTDTELIEVAQFAEEPQTVVVAENKQKHSQQSYAFRPVFTIGIKDQSGSPRYLQIDLSVMSRNEKVMKLVDVHQSLLRGNLLTLFSNMKYEDLYSAKGKEALRKKALKTLQSVLEEQTGEQGIDALYFTKLVLL